MKETFQISIMLQITDVIHVNNKRMIITQEVKSHIAQVLKINSSSYLCLKTFSGTIL